MDWEREQEGEKDDRGRTNSRTSPEWKERAEVPGGTGGIRGSSEGEEAMGKQLSRNEQSLQKELEDLADSWETRREEKQEKLEEKLQQREEVENKEVSMETIQPEVTKHQDAEALNVFSAGEIRDKEEKGKEVLSLLKLESVNAIPISFFH